MPATPDAVPLVVTPSTPSEPALVPWLVPTIAAPEPFVAPTKPPVINPEALMLPLTDSSPVIASLPLMVSVEPLCLTIESVTLALPPLLEKRGTKPV
jgi:hypothetical protein